MGHLRRRLPFLPLLLLGACASANPAIHRGALLGHRFVAEGIVYTAGHLEPALPEVGPDLIVLATSPRRGFEACREPHAEGDEVLLLCASEIAPDPRIRGRICGARRLLAVTLERGVYPGLSGAPLFCAEHRAVLGALVAGDERTAVVSPLPARPDGRGTLAAAPAGTN